MTVVDEKRKIGVELDVGQVNVCWTDVIFIGLRVGIRFTREWVVCTVWVGLL